MQDLYSVPSIAALALKHKPAFHVPWRPALMKYAAEYTAAIQPNALSAGCKLADPCMLAAIVTRESGGQNILQRGVSPGLGCGVGLCQITAGVNWNDLSKPTFEGMDLMDPAQNIYTAAHYFLEPALERFPNDHIAAFAAYNLGASGVETEMRRGLSPDAWTTGGDYGHDVFTNWINFVAASLQVNVDWKSWNQKAA